MAKQNFFRIGNKDSVQWDGSNIDVTHKGVILSEIRPPKIISLIPKTSPEEPTRSGSVYLSHGHDFRLVYKQGSIVDELGAAVKLVSEVPGLLAGGGAQEVARQLSEFINKQVTDVKLGVSAEVSVPLSRRAKEDGDRSMIILAIARSMVKVERSSEDIKFEAEIKMDSGRSHPWTGGPNDRERFTFNYYDSSRPSKYSDYIKDGMYTPLQPGGSKLISANIELRAELPKLIPTNKITEFMDTVIGELRKAGLTEKKDGEEKVAEPEPGALNRFLAGLLSVLKTLINALVASVKTRIVAASVTTTKFDFVYISKPPKEVKETLAMQLDQEHWDKSSALVSTKVSGPNGETQELEITLEDPEMDAALNAELAAMLLKATGVAGLEKLEMKDVPKEPREDEF